MEAAARRSYGRLVALLSARSRDIAASEDALADAFERALATWPADGVPDNPEAWLLAVARRRLIDDGRRAARAHVGARTLEILAGQLAEDPPDAGEIDVGDERLKLLFVCAHPAIEPTVRTPMMLQTVLGLDARRIASAFLTSPAAMSQALVRAKRKVRDAGVPFEVPDAKDLGGRLPAVMEAIYAARSATWSEGADGDGSLGDLAVEAEWLARVLAELLPDEPEATGLLALMLYSNSRTAARSPAAETFIPLGDQDVALWDHARIDDAERLLKSAARYGRPGRFQIEAAIQSVYAARRRSGAIDWRMASRLHEALEELAPSLGNRVARAAAVGNAQSAAAGLRAIDDLYEKRCDAYQPYWAVRAHFLAATGRAGEATLAYRSAIGLTSDVGVRNFLLAKLKATTSD